MTPLIFTSTLFGIGITLLIILILLRYTKPIFHSHWNTLLDNFYITTYDFYELLKKKLEVKRISGLEMYTVKLKQSHQLSDRRIYLRMTWRNYQYDVCAAPFSTGFFVSWWLLQKVPVSVQYLQKIPYVGTWLVRTIYRETYYKYDTASMFMTYVHQAVQEVIKDITEEKGQRNALSELASKPILNDVFKR